MGALWVLNFILLGLPIGGTLGILVGVQSSRSASGQAPLFKPVPPGPGEAPNDDSTLDYDLCDTSDAYSPPSIGDVYTLNANPWGWQKGQPGQICLNITQFNNHTYATKHTAPEWSVTWQYDQREENPVHAFPNVKVDNQILPVSIGDMKTMLLDIEWTYGVGKEPVEETDESALKAASLNANVAVDIFLGSTKDESLAVEKAKWEIMIWLATFGPATQPLGFASGSLKTQQVNGTTFDLYYAQNQLGQHVLSWVTDKYTEKFHGDLGELIKTIVGMGNANFPTTNDFMGYMSTGTEAFSSLEFVTFHNPELAVDIEVN